MSLSIQQMEEVHKEICPKLVRMIYRQWKKKSLFWCYFKKGDQNENFKDK